MRATDREWPYFVNPEVVGGPGQFFRRAAWQQIDGYVPWGGEREEDQGRTRPQARITGSTRGLQGLSGVEPPVRFELRACAPEKVV